MVTLPRVFWVVLLVVLVACEPTATPYPADVAALPTSTRDPNALTSLRYGIAANAEGLVSDLAAIQVTAQVEYLTEAVSPDDLGTRYDLVAAYGDLPGGTRSPITQQVSLVINPQAAIFADAVVADVIPRVIDTPMLVANLNLAGVSAAPDNIPPTPAQSLRVELANAGWPDGVDVSIGYDAPGIAIVAQQLEAGGIHVRSVLLKAEEMQVALTEKRIELALVGWTTADEHAQWVALAGADKVIDLFSMPISYLAVPGLKITFTLHGWPLAAR